MWLEAAVASLVRGPTADESARGLTSWFSSATADVLESVSVDAKGHATIDFREELTSLIPNASTSNGARMLLAELRATVFDIRGIESVEFRLGGSCEAFTEWLQGGGCHVQRASGVGIPRGGLT